MSEVHPPTAAVVEPPRLTTRQRLNRTRRLTLFCLALPGVMLVLSSWSAATWGLFPAGVILIGAAVATRLWRGRCGQCGGRLSRMFSCGGWPWSVSRAVRYCPFCGAPIDQAAGDTAGA